MIEAIILSMINSSSLAYVYFLMLSVSKYLNGSNVLWNAMKQYLSVNFVVSFSGDIDCVWSNCKLFSGEGIPFCEICSNRKVRTQVLCVKSTWAQHCSGEESGQKTPVQLMFCVNFSLKTQTAWYCNLTSSLRTWIPHFWGIEKLLESSSVIGSLETLV